MMDRLTIRTTKGAALKMNDTYPDEASAVADLMHKYRIAVDRLAAYEDTGLEPEEVKALADGSNKNATGTHLPNKPLTLEELKAHISQGHPHEIEPLYIVFDPPMPIDYAPRWRDAYNLLQLVKFDADNYGKTWLAYRRKPEGEQYER